MHAKVTRITFHPDSEEEALNFIRNRMFPSASAQRGFKDAFIFQNTAEQHKYTLISVWESEEAMQASAPPEDLLPELQHFDTLIAEASQDTHTLLFQFSAQSQRE
ncbi:MAG TPA: antibiotic biosynthesis monooxygenase family protein [Ktedonobacteraceae bacterium]|nr:antibiotic biosynthesis monooxygenase family protein [Ktedonobacteraceae bacterium]